MPDISYIEPTSLDEVFDALDRYGDDAKLLSGGTGLVNLMKQRLVQPACLIGLRRLPGLSEIQRENGVIRIGGLVTQREAEVSPLLKEMAPLLAETYRRVATIRIRNVATVGGGLAHGDPNQDPPASLVVLDAKVRLSSRSGTRELPIEEFYQGYYETALEPGEVVTEAVIPEQPVGSSAVYVKFLPRTADDYATVSVAAMVTLEADGATCKAVRVALGSVGVTPIRASSVEAALRGQRLTPEAIRDASLTVRSVVEPLDDFRGSAEYKRDMAVVWTRRALEQALATAKGSLQ